MAGSKTYTVGAGLYPEQLEKLEMLAEGTNLTTSEILRRLIMAATPEMVLAQPRRSKMGRPRMTEKMVAERVAG